eukprot:13292943-Alexandrium_andersonii.AAC.1
MDCDDRERCATVNCVYSHPPGHQAIGEAAKGVRRKQRELAEMRARAADREAERSRRELQQARNALAAFWPAD